MVNTPPCPCDPRPLYERLRDRVDVTLDEPSALASLLREVQAMEERQATMLPAERVELAPYTNVAAKNYRAIAHATAFDAFGCLLASGRVRFVQLAITGHTVEPVRCCLARNPGEQVAATYDAESQQYCLTAPNGAPSEYPTAEQLLDEYPPNCAIHKQATLWTKLRQLRLETLYGSGVTP